VFNFIKKNTLASQILIRVFSIYLLIASIVTISHIFWQYQDTKLIVAKEIEDSYAMVAPSLTKSLWDYNNEQINETLKGLELLPFISSVFLTDTSGETYTSKGIIQSDSFNKIKQDELIVFSAPLIHSLSKGNQTKKNQQVVGTLVIYGDNNELYQRMKWGVWLLIINAMIKTLALWFTFIAVGRFMISRPLNAFTEATKRLNLNDSKPLNIDIQVAEKNELKDLEESFNDMTLRLYDARKEITYQNTIITSVLNGTPDLIFYKDYLNNNGMYIGCNSAFEKFVGQGKSNIIGHNDIDLFGEEVGTFFREKDKNILLESKTKINEEWVDYPDGEKVLLSTSKTPFYNEDGEVLGVMGVSRDITQMYKATQDIKEQKLFLQTIIDGINDPVLVIKDDYTILLMNESAKANIDESIVSNMEYPKCYEVSHHSQTPCDSNAHPCPLNEIIKTKKPVSVIHDHPDKFGNSDYFEISSTPLMDKEHNIIGVIESTRNITAHIQDKNALKKQKDILDYKAHYDGLTGLPNRELFIDRLTQAIKSANRSHNLVAVLFIDLDHFKDINDSLGHQIGDEVLKEVSNRLKHQIRETDTIARLGGDEFTVIIDALHDTSTIIDIVNNLINSMNTPLIVDEHKLYSTISIGVALFPDDGSIPDVLLKNADAAMYKAKDEGRNTYRFYTEEMTEKAFERIVMETHLRQALKNEEFVVYYQPQVDGQNNQIIGMEALIRWKHETMGLVSPAKFISLAEETGLIVPLDQWTMRTAMKQFVNWYAEGLKPGVLALNLAMKQLQQKDFIEILSSILKETECKPEWVELEVTEGQIMSNPDKSIIILNQISDMGIELSVDDFGTGYSSLTYLKRLPIDKLKIDQSFIKNLPDDADDSAIAQSVIALSQNLHLKVIAEGVENEAQKDFLVKHGCRNIQGYYYAKPMPSNEMEQYLRRVGLNE